MKKTLAALTVFTTLGASAHGDHKHDHSEHVGAHEHGVANLNLVLEGDELKVMMESPAMNIMGFEYEPKTEADLTRSHDDLHYLQDGDWVVMNGGECKFHEGDVNWKYAEKVHAKFHEKEDGHKHEHEHSHDHDHSGHSDIDVRLDFDCNSPTAISSVAIELFEKYTGFEKINVQWIVGDQQGATTLTKDSYEISFK